MPPTILSIGQCGFDNSRLTRFFHEHLHALVDAAYSADEARKMLDAKKYDLILVNRIFDADGASGLDFIAQLRPSQRDPAATTPAAAPPIMLISNYPEAQATAIAHGALPGFGKNDLADPNLAPRLQTLLQQRGE